MLVPDRFKLPWNGSRWSCDLVLSSKACVADSSAFCKILFFSLLLVVISGMSNWSVFKTSFIYSGGSQSWRMTTK
jgi:hypothetical protein